MKIQVQKNTVGRIRDEILLAGIFEGAKTLQGSAAEIDKCCRGMIKKIIGQGDFTGKLHQVLLLYPQEGLATKRVLLVGLGKEKEFTRDRLRGAAACACRYARDMGLKSLAVPLSFPQPANMELREKARDLAEGALLGVYQFKEFMTKKNNGGNKKITTLTLLVNTARELAAAQDGAKKAEVTAEAVYLARDLVSRPGNNATPSFLAGTAREIAKKSGLACKVIDAHEAGRLGMGSFLSIARGSHEPAQFIILEHKPGLKKQLPAIVLIGKAITFDSGGISLKPAKDMEEMKTDMAGGAAVMGALLACARLALPVHAVGIIPATENLPSGHALKPGDIVTSLSGKTIEIITTDAEGRLILADALTYAQRYKPSAIIDLATLTGACVIALGSDVSGLMGTDDGLIEKIRSAAEKTGEKVWQLPLWDEYGVLIKSDIADLKNTGGRAGGAITAAYFLKEFSGKTPWAHLDIAGTAWTKTAKPYIPKGATGVGVRLLVELLESWARAS